MPGAADPITSLDSGGPASAPAATDAPPAGLQATSEMFGAVDPITSLDSGGPASAPGATDAAPNTGPQAPVQEEEEMGRRGRGRGKRRGQYVSGELESDASSAGTSGTEEAEEEAEESESYRAEATGTTKKRKRDRRKNKNFKGEAPVGGDHRLVARKLEGAAEDYNEFVSRAPPAEKCDLPAVLAAQEEDDKGDDMEMDDDTSAQEEEEDIMSPGDQEGRLTPAEIEEWFAKRRMYRLRGDEAEWSDTVEEDDEDVIYCGGEEGEEDIESHHEKSDPLAAFAAQEDWGTGKDMEAEDDIFWRSELEILCRGEWTNEGYEGHHDRSDPVAALTVQDEGIKGECMKTDYNTSSGGKSEEETVEKLNMRKRLEEALKERDRNLRPRIREFMDRKSRQNSTLSISEGDEDKDAKGEESWKTFYVPYASEIKTLYAFAEQAERNGWSTKLREWPCDIPRWIKHKFNAGTIMLEKRYEIRRLDEIQHVSEFCERLVTWEPYIKHGDSFGTSLECLKKHDRIPVNVSASLIIEAIQFLKVLLHDVECFFHPLIREGHQDFLRLAVRMHFRVKRHKLEEFFERNSLGIFRHSFPHLDRAIEWRKKESKEAQQVTLHKKFDNYISSSDFEKEVQRRNFPNPEELAEELEITKNDLKDLDKELIKVSLAERCKIIQLRHEIGAYSECLIGLLKDDQVRSQFAPLVNGPEKAVKNNEDVSVDDKLSQILPVVHERYFRTLPKYYAVKGILHYLKLLSSNKDNNKKFEYEELLSCWCSRICRSIDLLWKETRSYDEKAHKAMRQPLMEGVFDCWLDL